MSRGALYITWSGDIDPEPVLRRSIASLKATHPDLPYHVVRLPQGANLLDKAKMNDLSPFDTTLFLDADTVVCGDLSYGFDMSNRHGMACCICEAPYARRYAGLKNSGDLREFNTGVIFWNRNQYQVAGVFDRWKTLAQDIDSSILFHGENGLTKMPWNDQASFSAACDQLKYNPFVLPLNWNFRPVWQKSMYGNCKIWHDYSEISNGVVQWNASQSKPDAVMGFCSFD